ncbi:MAG: hypothetical protein JWM88_3274, partial [Verrucomicrobia bacterium]|nr:hypothetical protein [Verrucomicrobiota bacterium]
GAPERRDYAGERRPGGERRPAYAGGPRRDGGPAGDRGASRYADRGEPPDRGLYDSPYFAATFYPEDTSFAALAKTIRTSCRTIELFEIARTVIDKLDRFVVVLTRKAAAGDAKPAPISVSVPDGLPFETDEAAIAHVLSTHLDKFFERAEVEIEPPKGNFLVINKCTVTGELLGPPNYHRYNQIVQQHHAARIRGMPLEAYRSRIETIRDPEVVAQWLEKMKKATRYAWKPPGKAPKTAPTGESPASTEESTAEIPTAIPAPAAEPVAAVEPAATVETASAPSLAPADSAATPPVAAPITAPAPTTFDTLEEARTFLLANARDKVVRQVESARFHGKIAEALPPGEIRRATEGALERQRRFPLDTANALRGRLRRERFTIFKKGSKGISYVCAVKRKFRVPGQTFAESIGALISFIEAHPMIRASELITKFLGIKLPAPAKPSVAGEAPAEAAPAAEPLLSIDDRAKIARMQGDLRWLVTEGYVTEFIDGRLFAPPPMAEARKKEVEAEEHDPENFPEAPVSVPPFEGKASDAPAPAEIPAMPAAPAAETASHTD